MASSPPLLKRFSNYANSGPGLENMLRILQYSCQALGAYTISPADAKPWNIASTNFALGRRYFRFFKFIDCFDRAWASLPWQDNAVTSAQKGGYVASALDACTWSTLGCYIFLEALTILDAMGIWVTPWSRGMLLESHKFWFYSIAFSLLGSVWQLFLLSFGSQQTAPAASSGETSKTAEKKTTSKNGRNGAKENDRAEAVNLDTARYIKLLTDILVASCDILAPGFSLGWIKVTKLTMSSACVLSGLVVGTGRWATAQRSA